MGGFTPVPIDPLPQPATPQVEPKPAQTQRQDEGGGFQGYPMQAGYTGGLGKTANIMSNFLSGWMAGKHMQEQKKLDAALRNVGNYETDYKNSMTIYQTVLNNPDSSAEQKEKARQDVLTNWHELHEVQKKYLMPDEGTGKKKQSVGDKIKSKVKGAFQAQDPHLFASSAIDLADKVDPTAGMRTDPKTEAANLELAERKQNKQKQDEYSTLLKKPNKTPEEQKRLEGIEDELYGPGTSSRQKLGDLQLKEEQQRNTDLEAARRKYQSGGEGALNEREKSILQNAGELPKDKQITNPFEAYAQDVGPGKKFSSYSQAADAYMKKEINLEKAARQPSMWEEMTNAGKAVLGEQFAKQDADPSKPHTYRITIGGKTEDRQLTDEQVKAAQQQDKNLKAVKVPSVPTKGDVYGWVAEHIKPSPQEKEDAKPDKPKKEPTPAQLQAAMGPVYATVIEGHPEWERFVAKRPGPAGGVTMALNPFEEKSVGFFERGSTVRKDYQDFLQAVQNEMIRRGAGEYINKVLPGMDQSITPQEMTPTP